MKTYHIHIQGQVQGVGFRPWVYQRAHCHGLTGWVSNGTDGVHVMVNASETLLDTLVHELLHNHPPIARITSHRVQAVLPQSFDGFSIIHSQATDTTSVLLTPDLALCEACRAELHVPTDRRYHYAFTSCTQCGPRYSITQALPYDRATTTMAPFVLCSDCQREYDDPTHRRYYAQTNSCPRCPVTLTLYDGEQTLVTSDASAAVQQGGAQLREGAIVAVKGIGGYLLLCDATNATAVATLRARKQRPTKPLAVLYPSLAVLSEDITLTEAEQAALTGAVSPVVLLSATKAVRKRLAYDAVTSGLDRVGVMLPYAPLLDVLLHEVNRPLVATSGNVSGSPIAYTEGGALKQLHTVADSWLTHDRAIAVPQDDSVVTYSPQEQQRIVVRRSRGMAPTFVPVSSVTTDACVLAVGSQLKSTFTFTHQGQMYVSQYLGDLDNYDTQQRYQQVLQHLFTQFRIRPTVIITDAHPQYSATQYGRQLANDYSADWVAVPHHQAHFSAVLGEHDLIEATEPILGVVWDGTGLGTDGQIWGGEFFVQQSQRTQRVRHIAYFRHLLGDKMAREPRLSALSLAYERSGAVAHLRSLFSEVEWQYYCRQLQSAGLLTSSVGRLFDAVACLLGLATKVSYEGEAALQLETLARRYVGYHGYTQLRSYYADDPSDKTIATEPLIDGIVADLPILSKEEIAARFHYSLVHLIQVVARQQQIRQIAFSGGVFQNALLVDMIHNQLSDYQLYFHQQLSPNDENISFGQLMYYLQSQAVSVDQVAHRSLVAIS